MNKDKFTPIAEVQGLTLTELKNIIRQRPLYIWGAGFLGRAIKRLFERNGFTVKAFLDINPDLNMVESIAVLRPQNVIANIKKEGAFLIPAVGSQSAAIERHCLEAGLEKNKDFLPYMRMPRQQAVIEAGGACNYACSVCVKQNSALNYMSAELYKKVLNKLAVENPLLLSVDLSLWREPLLNPEIAEIIRITKEYVPCKLITKLQHSVYLEKAVKASPDQIQINAEGYEKTYEQNQTGGGRWQTFLENLHKLKEYKDKHNVNTEIYLMYILYKNNAVDDFNKMRNLCASLGFKIGTDTAYLTPYDNFLDVCEGRVLSPQIQKIKDLLPWNIDAVLKLCVQNGGKPCLCQRIFPVINYDASVLLCHLFCKAGVIDNFFDVSYDEIVKMRVKNDFCKVCQRYGLHRLDIDVLKKYFPEKDMA
ncbi:MAG: radical SAM protein [Spirochaetaceae bacterium]|jgi:hypothetical protein|nr:radical SAM protein [Spirochaetaceae bacterium]